MNQKLMEQVTKLSAETAVQAALEFMENERQKRQKEKRDRRLRNTKLLLKHYRSFVVHCEDLKRGVTEAQERELIDDLDSEEFAVESIKRSKERTIAMVNFINRMLEMYKIMCERSDRPEEIRRYQTIHDLYISEEKISAEKIALGQKIDIRTVYKDADKAVKSLSVLVFGVDGVRMFE